MAKTPEELQPLPERGPETEQLVEEVAQMLAISFYERGPVRAEGDYKPFFDEQPTKRKTRYSLDGDGISY